MVNLTNSTADLDSYFASVYATYSKKVIYNPNPILNSESFYKPDYVLSLGNYTNNSTTLGKIYNEYTNKINSIAQTLQAIATDAQRIHENLSEIVAIYSNLIARLNQLESNVDNLSTVALDPLSNFVKKINYFI